MHPTHPHNEIAPCALEFSEPARGLDLLGGEYRDRTAYHVGRDLDLSPAHQVGEPLGHTVKGSRVGDHRKPAFPHRLPGPGYPDVGAKQSLVRREPRESGIDEIALRRGNPNWIKTREGKI